MVLSNKKLKQKLRSLLLSSSESQSHLLNHDSHSFKSLLNSVTQKPNLSKRQIRRLKTPSDALQTQAIDASESNDAKKNINKRKREKKDATATKDVKKSGKKIKKKKQKLLVVVNKDVQKADDDDDDNKQPVAAEPIQIETSNEDANICTKIYVGGIPYYSTVDDIQSFFEGCGSVTEIDCLKFPETGKFNGIAMISFRTEAAAKRALALDGSDMGGLSLKIQPYKAARDKKVSDFAPAMLEGYNRIYVGNLSWDMTEVELKKFFSDCSISAIRLSKDKETGEFKGFAHVDFVDSLSLTMALKLDQKPLFGRPVRIRCAVPLKSANPGSKVDPAISKNVGDAKLVCAGETIDTVVDDDVSRKAKRQTCYDCGEKGHISSSCPKKMAADVTHMNNDDKVEADSISDGTLKRRTCYECGEKGHLSSSCPNKKAVDVTQTFSRIDDVAFGIDEKEDNNIADGKLKRRTCYECGEKGHLSSSCPNKKAADVANSRPETFASVVVKDNEEVDYNMVNSISDGKLRRRTCYECGERGHLSSACPKKEAADVVSSIKEANDVEVKKADVTFVGTEVSNDVVTSISEGKLRRRTCYECGERGHLSSLCPKKQTTNVVSSSNVGDDVQVEEAKTTVVVSHGKLKRRNCYECGLKGHVSALCPNK